MYNVLLDDAVDHILMNLKNEGILWVIKPLTLNYKRLYIVNDLIKNEAHLIRTLEDEKALFFEEEKKIPYTARNAELNNPLNRNIQIPIYDVCVYLYKKNSKEEVKEDIIYGNLLCSPLALVYPPQSK
jgi:hypothetical protein